MLVSQLLWLYVKLLALITFSNQSSNPQTEEKQQGSEHRVNEKGRESCRFHLLLILNDNGESQNY